MYLEIAGLLIGLCIAFSLRLMSLNDDFEEKNESLSDK